MGCQASGGGRRSLVLSLAMPKPSDRWSRSPRPSLKRESRTVASAARICKTLRPNTGFAGR